jgi:hypothetical protein
MIEQRRCGDVAVGDRDVGSGDGGLSRGDRARSVGGTTGAI